MRHGRAKAIRKTLQFFERTIGIKSPYNIIVDGTFLVAAITYKVPIIERFVRLVQHGSTFTLYCTSTTISELESILEHHRQKKSTTGKRIDSESNNNNSIVDKTTIFQQAIDFVHENCTVIDSTKRKDSSSIFTEQCSTQFGVSESCIKKLSPTATDLLEVLTDASLQTTDVEEQTTSTSLQKSNDPASSDDVETSKKSQHNVQRQSSKHQLSVRYLCASQDDDLLDILRQIGHVPIIRLARGSVLLLEQPSKYAQGAAIQEEKSKWKASSAAVSSVQEQALLDTVKKEHRLEIRQAEKDRIAKKRKIDSELYGGTKIVSEYDRRKGNRKRIKQQHATTGGKGVGRPNPLSCKKKKRGINCS